jgi:hypothetical protein
MEMRKSDQWENAPVICLHYRAVLALMHLSSFPRPAPNLPFFKEFAYEYFYMKNLTVPHM